MDSSLFLVPLVRWAQIATQPADWSLGPRRIYDHQFVYVIQGHVAVTIDEQQFTAIDHHLLLLPPRLPHRFEGLGGKVHHMIGIHFDWVPRADTPPFTTHRHADEACNPALFRDPQNVPEWDRATTPALDLRGRPRVYQLLHDAVTNFDANEYSRLQVGGLMIAAIAQMAHEAVLLRSVETNSRLGADAVRRVHRARELLEAAHPLPLSVSEVGTAVGWSADHLGRMCREVLGVSPYRLQMKARLRRAAELLCYGDVSVADVARQCGFNDASKFASAFKRETGLSPRQHVQRDDAL